MFYWIGPAGNWNHAAHVVPGNNIITIPHADFPEANSCEVIHVQFKPLNGLGEGAVAEDVEAAVNHPPRVAFGDDEPVLQDFGQRIEIPLHVSYPGRDPVALYYKLGDSTEWSPVPVM
jgi:hypothetical protein